MLNIKILLKRIPSGILTLLGLSILVFGMMRLIPTDPVRAALGTGASEEAVQQYRDELGFNEPLPIQYIIWLGDVLQGDLGVSLRTNQPVAEDILSVAPATFELMFIALMFAVGVGVPLGMISGLWKDSLPDHFARFAALSGVSFPRFWLAIVLQIVFVTWLGLFPLTGRINGPPPDHITGMYTIDSILTLNATALIDAVWHLILPAIALGFSTLAQITRMIRSEMIEVQKRAYIEASVAYGLPRDLIAYKYMLKNSFSSSLTIIGFEIGGMIGGAVLVELIFNINGIGRYALFAILNIDYNAIIGVTLLLGSTYLISNAIVDVLYTSLDPRGADRGVS